MRFLPKPNMPKPLAAKALVVAAPAYGNVFSSLLISPLATSEAILIHVCYFAFAFDFSFFT